jgi:hypothetical protein
VSVQDWRGRLDGDGLHRRYFHRRGFLDWNRGHGRGRFDGRNEFNDGDRLGNRLGNRHGFRDWRFDFGRRRFRDWRKLDNRDNLGRDIDNRDNLGNRLRFNGRGRDLVRAFDVSDNALDFVTRRLVEPVEVTAQHHVLAFGFVSDHHHWITHGWFLSM